MQSEAKEAKRQLERLEQELKTLESTTPRAVTELLEGARA